jgi:flagellar biosynthesis protein FlhA
MASNIKLSFSLIGVILIGAMFLIPFPAIVVDIMIAMNFILVILILLNVFYTKKATDFSLLPTIVLVSMVFSLSVNLSSARLILTKGADFDGRAIRAVSSLFALDSLPGKQMAIDAEYSGGKISEEEYSARKDELQRESDFYGALEGSSKFILGNVKFILFLIFVVIFGGIAIDTLLRGEEIIDAVKTYSFLSIGYGLLSFFPVFLVSLATGITVTRAAVRKAGSSTP